jgi:glycosyltransferase involved in cell wall biosynthesis
VDNHNSIDCQEIIHRFKPDLIVIANTRLLHKEVLAIPKFGCLNVHSSLLPRYAGLDSIFWALYYNEKEIGVTVHSVIERLDRGDILLQKRIRIQDYDTQQSLCQKSQREGAILLNQAISLIAEGKITPIVQDLRQASYFGWPTRAQRHLLPKKLKRRAKAKHGQPVRVLHIITRLVKGGAQENTLLTVLGLKAKGYQVVLASGPTLGPEGEIESKARAQGVDLIIIPELIREINLFKDIICTFKLYNLIRKEHFDIVHTHTSKAGIIGRLAAWLAGVPIIIHTPHGHIFHSYFGPVRTGLFRILEVIFAGFCDKIITLTDSCKDEHVQLGIAAQEKFITISSGVETDRFLTCPFDLNRAKNKLGIPFERKVIGTVCRLEPIKGINFFLDSLPRVLKVIPECHYLIVGDGSQRKELEERVKRQGLQGRVTFTGIRDDIPALIGSMDLVVLASLNEGMGRVLVEAGLMGKAVVATRVSGIPELVEAGRTGILVEPASAEALAGGIIELLSNPDQARLMGKNAKEKMLKDFSAEGMVDKIDCLYKEFL